MLFLFRVIFWAIVGFLAVTAIGEFLLYDASQSVVPALFPR